jgi:3D (Asp-Asp-Asp) domain-containing protein
MLKGIPASEVGDSRSWRNRNVVDRGKYYDVRAGSYTYGVSPPLDPVTGNPQNLNARAAHDALGLIVWQFGTTVYVSGKDCAVFTEVYNFASVDPDDIYATDHNDANTMIPLENDMILGTRNGIFRIVLDEDFYYMYRINIPTPDSLITDINENVAGGVIYGYLYVYSMSKIEGVGNRNRMVGTDNLVVLETGTSKPSATERDYSECYFDEPIGDDLTELHVIGDMTVPAGVQEVTHFSLYRTKNIGEASGGKSPDIDGLGNRTDLMVWVDDIPVCKCFEVIVASDVAWRVAGVGNVDFEYGDVGNDLQLIDTTDPTGATVVNTTIADYNAGTNADLPPAAVPDGTYIAGIGHGRLFWAVQVGHTVTIAIPNAGVFVAADVGKAIFKSDGGTVHIIAVLGATSVTVAEDDNWGLMPCMIQPVAGNFYRKYNDITPDTYEGDARISLDSRIIAAAPVPMYIPRRFFYSLPNCNVLAIECGFMVCGIRGESRYYYSQFGDKWFCLGCYRNPQQTRKAECEIRDIRGFANGVAIFSDRKVLTLNLTSFTDMGRTEVGENCFVLSEHYVASKDVGVLFWQSIQAIRSGVIIALTSEPAVRTFDGAAWSTQNFAVDQQTGDDAVGCELVKLDPSLSLCSAYSKETGYILWFYKWVDDADVDLDLSNVVYDHGGVVGVNSVADEVWNDNGGVWAGPVDDVTDDNGGSIWQ